MATFNSNVDLITGNQIMIFLSGSTTNPIAYGKTCDLTITTGTIDTTNKMSGMFKSTLSGQISWTLASDFMFTSNSGLSSFNTLLASQLAGTSLNVVVGITTDTSTFAMTTGMYSGVARITSLNMKSETNAIVACSLSLEGSGALTKLP